MVSWYLGHNIQLGNQWRCHRNYELTTTTSLFFVWLLALPYRPSSEMRFANCAPPWSYFIVHWAVFCGMPLQLWIFNKTQEQPEEDLPKVPGNDSHMDICSLCCGWSRMKAAPLPRYKLPRFQTQHCKHSVAATASAQVFILGYQARFLNRYATAFWFQGFVFELELQHSGLTATKCNIMVSYCSGYIVNPEVVRFSNGYHTHLTSVDGSSSHGSCCCSSYDILLLLQSCPSSLCGSTGLLPLNLYRNLFSCT